MHRLDPGTTLCRRSLQDDKQADRMGADEDRGLGRRVCGLCNGLSSLLVAELDAVVSRVVEVEMFRVETPEDSFKEFSLRFRYKNLETLRTIDRCLSVKGLKRFRSVRNGYWEVYYNGWQPNITISYDQNDQDLVIIQILSWASDKGN